MRREGVTGQRVSPPPPCPPFDPRPPRPSPPLCPRSGLTDEEQATQRMAFLHFMQSCAGTEIEADMADGKPAVKGYFHTGTPFKDRPFRVSIKSGRRGDGDETAAEIGATQVASPYK